MHLLKMAAIAVAAVVSIAAAPHGDWTATYASGAGGSHVMGNPEAPVKLTEFISYTCSHCATFHKQSEAALKLAYIQPGKLSLEIRHLVRDPVDLAAGLIANCGDARGFFRTHNTLLQTQDKWITIMASASAGQKARWSSGDFSARMRAIASDFGFYQMMEQRGYQRPALDRCLADQAMARKLTAQTEAAIDAGVEGTPAFMLNGALLAGTHDWQELSSQIQARF